MNDVEIIAAIGKWIVIPFCLLIVLCIWMDL